MSATAAEVVHRMRRPFGEVVERPCNGWCRDGLHALLVFTLVPYDWLGRDGRPVYGEEDIRESMALYNPEYSVVEVLKAPEARRYPDQMSGYDFGWVVLATLAGKEGTVPQ